MPAKEIAFHQPAREAILRGVQTLAEAVAVTLGPRGRNVVIEKSWGSPTVTKDGVTVAKEIEVESRFENMGAQMVREVASKTSDKAGDRLLFGKWSGTEVKLDGEELIIMKESDIMGVLA